MDKCLRCHTPIKNKSAKRKYCDSCGRIVRGDKRRKTMAINKKHSKSTVDPKWLVRGAISNYNMSDVISNGS